MSKAARVTEAAQLLNAEKNPIRVDVTQLRLGTRVKYQNLEGIEHYGLVSNLTEKRATIQLWMEFGDKQAMMVREENVALANLKEILGQLELPKPAEEPKKPAVLAPKRPEGYKDCDRKGCEKAIHGVVSTQATRREISGFKFGSIEPAEDSNALGRPVLVALCSSHYKQRDEYGLVGDTWFAWPKPPEKPTDTAVETPQMPKEPKTPSPPKEKPDANSSAPVKLPEAKSEGKRVYKTKLTKDQLKARAKLAAAARWNGRDATGKGRKP